MQRNTTYTYSQSNSGHSRYSSSHATSSAFSASANPNEDWTKISDLAERRRIQNRIAQRNYRKKLKRRLEDLERRASTGSQSPEPKNAEIATPPSEELSLSNAPAMRRQTSTSTVHHSETHESPELLPFDDKFSTFGVPTPWTLPATSPPELHYSTYPTSSSYFPVDMEQQLALPNLGSYYSDYQIPSTFAQSLPPTLPTMLPTHQIKRENYWDEDDILNPFSMNYASLAGIDVSASHHYPESSSNVNPTNFLRVPLYRSKSEYAKFPEQQHVLDRDTSSHRSVLVRPLKGKLPNVPNITHDTNIKISVSERPPLR